MSINPIPYYWYSLVEYTWLYIPLHSAAPFPSSRCNYTFALLILPYLSYYVTTSLNLHLYFRTSTNTPGSFAFTPAASTTPGYTASGAALSAHPLPLLWMFPPTWTKLFHQNHCIPQVLCNLLAVPAATTTASHLSRAVIHP